MSAPVHPDTVHSTRRAFLAAAAGAAAAATGCLFNARTGLKPSAVLWKTFRFVHLTGLRLAFRGEYALHRLALEAAAAIRALPELDFALLGGDLVAGTDPMDTMLLEEFVHAMGLPWYAVPGPGENPEADRAASLGGRAWKTPWVHAPLPGVRLVGLSSGGRGADPLEEVPFLTEVLDRHPLEAILVLVARPVRLPETARSLGARALDAELLRFVLEAAPNVKLVLSGAPAPWIAEAAGLLHLGTPPLAAFPRLIREITVSGQGVAVRNRRLVTPGEEQERALLASSPAAARFDPAAPEQYVRFLEGESGRRVFALR